MPLIPGKAAMTLDNYRSLGWGMVDGVSEDRHHQRGRQDPRFQEASSGHDGGY